MSNKNDITLNDWEQALIEAREVPPVPPGWITIKKYSELIGRSSGNASVSMRTLVAKGKAERKIFVIRAGEFTRPVPHYRLKK